MATGSPFMGTLKGKLGETVAMRRNGKQVLRSYISNPKNPNSQKQQVQRMVQATAAQAYSAFKKICDHSFEGVQVGQKSMSYFMSKNMDLLRSKIEANPDGTLIGADADFVVKGVNLPVLNPYIVAKGTLPEVALPDSDYSEVQAFSPNTSLLLWRNGAPNLETLLQNFITSNSGQIGDWFTFMFLLRENGKMQNGQQIYRFAFIRFVVEETKVDDKSINILVPSLTSNGVPNIDWSDAFDSNSTSEESETDLALNISSLISGVGNQDSTFTPVAYSVIHSRQNVGGSWQRSNAEFVIRDNWQDLNITYPSNFDAALDSYAGAGQAKGTGDYVLNGGV